MRTRKFLMEYFSRYYSCFDTSRQVEKDVFPLVTSVGQRKNSESQLGIEPQTFGFHTPLL